MNEKRTSMIAIWLAAVLAVSPAVSFAQGTTTFSGEAVGLKASVAGISLDLADTGPTKGAAPSCRVSSFHLK